MSRYVVFPAHAGMSPPSWRSTSTAAGFPRTRGDEPALVDGLVDAGLFSPHTRG